LIHRLGSGKVYQIEKKKVGVVIFKKIGNCVIAQKPMTLFKQIARHRIAFFEIKSTCSSDFLSQKHQITLL
jgi:hypothetical protein